MIERLLRAKAKIQIRAAWELFRSDPLAVSAISPRRQKIFDRRSNLGRKKLRAIQQRPPEGSVVTGPGTFQVSFALEVGAHGLHLGIQVIHIVQEQRFREHGELGRAEFVLAMVADDEMLQQSLECVGKPGTSASLACSISSSMTMCPSNWPRVV